MFAAQYEDRILIGNNINFNFKWHLYRNHDGFVEFEYKPMPWVKAKENPFIFFFKEMSPVYPDELLTENRWCPKFIVAEQYFQKTIH